ncbi:MAG: transposase family protein [Gemmatimonadaceae bacterium]|nr:transposase family protein [Gemmatimonadaceae bacterium]
MSKAHRRDLSTQLKAVVSDIFTAGARLNQAGVLTDEQTRELRRIQKWPGRLQLDTAEDIAQKLETARSFRDQMQAALTSLFPDEVSAATSHGWPAPPRRDPAKRTPKPLPLSVSDLPPASFLDDLIAGKITWEAALQAPARTQEVSLARLINDPDMHAEFLYRSALLKLRGTHSAAAAAAQVRNREITPAEKRFAERLFQRAERGESEDELLVDRRHRRVCRPTVMVPLVQPLVLLFYNGRRKIKVWQLAQLVNAELVVFQGRAEAEGVRLPFPTASEETIQKFLARLPDAVKTVRANGLTAYAKQHRVVFAVPEALFANQIWEIDNSPLDIAAIADAESELEVERLWITAVIDAYSGYPLAVFVDSRCPTAYTTSIVLRAALTPTELAGVQVGGLPEQLICDRGADFASCHVETVTAALGIELREAPPRSPDEKPHIERFFRTLNESLAMFPGYKPADGTSKGAQRKNTGRLLTVQRIKAEVERFRVAYCQRESEKRNGSPLARFAETVQWKPLLHPDVVDLLLLKSDEERVLTRNGVRFGNHVYFGDIQLDGGHSFTELQKRKVIVRYHPDISDYIIVYDAETNVLLGEMIRSDLYGEQSAVSQINQRERLRLVAVTQQYSKALVRLDHQRAAEERARERDRERQKQRNAGGPMGGEAEGVIAEDSDPATRDMHVVDTGPTAKTTNVARDFLAGLV